MHGEIHYSTTKIALNDNERSFVIQVIAEINEYLKGRDIPIKRAGGEKTINGGSFVRFPDILLFSDRSQSLILQGWEAKCPDVPIDDQAFVEDARTKAKLLGCNSTVLWNFQYAQLHVCNSIGDFEIVEEWTIDSRITNREMISLYEQEWKSFLHSLIDKIVDYITIGMIRHRSLGEALTESVMPCLINENKGIVSEKLKLISAKDVSVKVYIDNWWESVQYEYMNDERDPYLAYSKIILIHWLNKLLFANLIQSQFDAARLIGEIASGCKIIQAIDVFNLITEKSDFYNIFSSLPYSDCLPNETWEDLVTFNELLLECDMGQLDSSYSHSILEESVSIAKRQIAGQYPTPEPLANLISEIVVRDAYGEAWDCCCGTGTIGCALWKRKHEILKDAGLNADGIAYETTWMSDIHDFPLQIATQSYSALSPAKLPLRIAQKNVFDVNPGKQISFIDPGTGKDLVFGLPRFKSIASNLPFVDFNTRDISIYDSVKSQLKLEYQKSYDISLSDRSDLYCYIALYLDRFLDDDGCMCLLTSNSWLCTSAGDSFMLALQATFDIDAIYANGTHRWFNNADVMNAVLVLKKKKVDSKPECFMGAINASIDDLSNESVRSSISRRIISHSSICRYCNESLVSWDQMKELRDLGLSYYTMCHGVAFMLELADRLCRVSSVFDVKRGTKSGQDKFFYSDDQNFVEEEFRLDLLKNFEEIKTFELRPSWYAFSCDKSIEYLEQNGCSKALKRIRSVSNPNQSCMAHKPYWYTLPTNGSVAFATTMNPGGRLFFAGAMRGRSFAANQRAICFTPKDPNLDEELCLALLNSTLGMFLIEASAAPMALGALDTRAKTFSRMYMLDPSLISQQQRDAIVAAFEPLKNREIKSALEELQQHDRREFDQVVFRAYGIEDYADSIRGALRGMLEVRLR